MELALLDFKDADGKERKARRINLSDYHEMRVVIRKERMASLGDNPDPVAVGTLASQMVTPGELLNRMVADLDGVAFLIFRCVNFVDQTFTKDDAENLLVAENPFVEQLFSESTLVNPIKPRVLFKDSLRPDGQEST